MAATEGDAKAPTPADRDVWLRLAFGWTELAMSPEKNK